MRPDERLARLFRLATLLQARAVKNVRDIARELEISERTAYRYLWALVIAGVPVRYDRETGGYRIDGDFFLPPVQLTLNEAMAVTLLGAQLADRRQLPFMEDASRALMKVRSQLPASIRDQVSDIDRQVTVQEARVSPQTGCQTHFRLIQSAISQRRKLRCRYINSDSGEPKSEERFLFRPYGLFFSQRAWYAIGYSERRHGERSLKLNRLTEVLPTKIPYMIPNDWSLKQSFGYAWRMIRGSKRYQVLIRFDADFGRSVADTLWHPTQTIARQAGGDYLFQYTVDGLEEIVWWVLGYGPHAEVIEPIELRQQINSLFDQTLQIYKCE